MDSTRTILIWTFIIVLVIIILGITIVWYLKQEDPYALLMGWSAYISDECDLQDSVTWNTEASYYARKNNKIYRGLYDAENFRQKNVRDLDLAIRTKHDIILSEALSYLNEHGGVPMIRMDEIQAKFYGADGWKPLWVKFINRWAPGSNRMPTLKNICKSIPGITLLHVSVMHPGTHLPMHIGPSRAVYRYHYGLVVPKGNLGLNIEGSVLQWEERRGFVWDDTLYHESWNKTDKPRLVIFADIKREIGPMYDIGTHILYSMVGITSHVDKAASVIEKYVTDDLNKPNRHTQNEMIG